METAPIQARLFPAPPPPKSPIPERVRETLSAVARAQLPTADPPQLVQWVCLPVTAMLWTRHLSPSGAALYLALWRRAARWCAGRPNRWAWDTDAFLSHTSGVAPRSLARARAELTAAELAFITANHPAHNTPTFYALRWPIATPAWADNAERMTFISELKANGQPWPRLEALCALVAPWEKAQGLSGTGLADLCARYARAKRAPDRDALAFRIRGVSPWLYRQLEVWADPDDCPKYSRATKPHASA